MRAYAWVEFKNKHRIVALVGAPPKRAKPFDIIGLQFRRGSRWNTETDQGVYMTPDEAAWTIAVLGRALQRVTTKQRRVFATMYRRGRGR